jgi:hypothetical protein
MAGAVKFYQKNTPKSSRNKSGIKDAPERRTASPEEFRGICGFNIRALSPEGEFIDPGLVPGGDGNEVKPRA